MLNTSYKQHSLFDKDTDNTCQANKVNERTSKAYQTIMEYINNNSHISEEIIKKGLFSEYFWLYRHDKEKFNVIKQNIKKRTYCKIGRPSIDWHSRDSEYYSIVEKAIETLRECEKPRRITLYAIFQFSGLRSHSYNLEDLPLTSALIKKNIETTHDFLLRKINFYYNKLYREGATINKAKIKTLANMYDYHYEDIEVYIDKLINR